MGTHALQNFCAAHRRQQNPEPADRQFANRSTRFARTRLSITNNIKSHQPSHALAHRKLRIAVVHPGPHALRWAIGKRNIGFDHNAIVIENQRNGYR